MVCFLGNPREGQKSEKSQSYPTSSTLPGAVGFIRPIGTQSWSKSTSYGSFRGHDQNTRIGVREEQTLFLIVLMRSAISSPGVLAHTCFVSVIWGVEGGAF